MTMEAKFIFCFQTVNLAGIFLAWSCGFIATHGGAVGVTASVTGGASTVTETYVCEGELVKTQVECNRLGDAGIGNGCWYNSIRRNFDTCQAPCNGKEVGSTDEDMCEHYCHGYLLATCKKYRPSSSTTSTTSTTTTHKTPTSRSNTRKVTSELTSPSPTTASTYASPKIVTTFPLFRSTPSTNTVCKKGRIAGLTILGLVILAFLIVAPLIYLIYRQKKGYCCFCKNKFRCTACWIAQNWFCQRFAIPGLRNKAPETPETASIDEEETSTSSLSSVETVTPEAPADASAFPSIPYISSQPSMDSDNQEDSPMTPTY